MNITGIFTDIANGLGLFIPAFFGGMLEAFVAIFLETTGEGAEAVTTLSPVGTIAIVFIVIGIAYKILPTVIGWLRLKARSRKRSRARAR